MKKLIYIVFAVFALGLASCSKQDIQPNTTSSDVEVPVWKSLGNGNDSGLSDPSVGNGTITDPENKDPEMESNGQ
jgi:hypothetical protein